MLAVYGIINVTSLYSSQSSLNIDAFCSFLFVRLFPITHTHTYTQLRVLEPKRRNVEQVLIVYVTQIGHTIAQYKTMPTVFVFDFVHAHDQNKGPTSNFFVFGVDFG